MPALTAGITNEYHPTDTLFPGLIIMSDYGWLTLYCVLVLLFSCLGGLVPFLQKVSHSRLQIYLSISAGFMLGAAFFHVMPEAFEKAKDSFGWWMALGTVGLFCIERFVAPHSHEIPGSNGHAHPHHEHDHDHKHVHHEHDHLEHPAAAPAIAGWMAVFGLTIHTFMNGFGLAAMVVAELPATASPSATVLWPGFAIFLAIVLHKPADALAISTVLTRKGVSRQKILLVQIGFALMVPVGAVAFILAKDAVNGTLQTELTGAALSFSAGTFLFLALSDLLPEVQFHRHDRVPLFLSLVFGVAFMGLIAILEGHEAHESHEPDKSPTEHPEHHPGAQSH